MDPIILLWIGCVVFNVFMVIIDALIIEKKLEITIGELILCFIFMVILAPMGSLLFVVGIMGRYHNKTIINWSKKEK